MREITGSEAYSFLICLDVTKFVLLGSFTFIQTIFSKFRAKPLPNKAKNTLPVGVRRSKESFIAHFLAKNVGTVNFWRISPIPNAK